MSLASLIARALGRTAVIDSFGMRKPEHVIRGGATLPGPWSGACATPK